MTPVSTGQQRVSRRASLGAATLQEELNILMKSSPFHLQLQTAFITLDDFTKQSGLLQCQSAQDDSRSPHKAPGNTANAGGDQAGSPELPQRPVGRTQLSSLFPALPLGLFDSRVRGFVSPVVSQEVTRELKLQEF